MTCIVGIEHDGGVVIGGDSGAYQGWSQTIRADEKVFTVGPYMMGVAGSPRVAQLLRYQLNVDEPDTWDVNRFIATTFIDTLRATLKDGGYAKREGEQESIDESCFLVSIQGRLYAIYADYQFSRTVDGCLSVGCGREFALGSLHTSFRYQLEPKIRIEQALEAAGALSGGVAPPFTILEQSAAWQSR